MSCDKRFPTKSELKRHEESVHESAKRFYCKIVPCRYNKTGAQNNGTYFGNDLCFGRLAAIRRHLKDVHRMTNDLNTWIEEENTEKPVENLTDRLLSAQIEEPYGSNSYFIPVDVLDKLLLKPNIRQHLRKIFPTMDKESLEFYAESICSTSKKLFAVLICTLSGAQSRAICNFIQEGINDTDLPFERLYLNDRPANSSGRYQMYTLAKKEHEASCTFPIHTLCGINTVSNWPRDQVQSFCRDQWLVLAPIFESTPGTDPPHRSFPESVVLPFTEDWENDSAAVKFGGYSEVWAIRIHPAHQQLLPTSRSVCCCPHR